MTTRNSKASTGGGVAEASQSTKINLQRDNNKTLPVMQPGTALTAFLKRYRNDLLTLPYNSHISRLVDCADFILDEVDRGQHD